MEIKKNPDKVKILSIANFQFIQNNYHQNKQTEKVLLIQETRKYKKITQTKTNNHHRRGIQLMSELKFLTIKLEETKVNLSKKIYFN